MTQEERQALGKNTHRKYQQKSKRCVGCGKILLTAESKSIRHCEAAGHFKVKYSGGKISHYKENVDHSKYCVHGVPLSDPCYYCPENERQEHMGDLED